MTQPDQISQPEYIEDEINLIDYFLVLLKHKRMIFCIVALAIILSVVVSLFLPKMYTATARVLPPKEPDSGLSTLLTQSSGPLGGLAGSFMQGKTTSDLYVGMLKSRTVADVLIKEFNLKELYKKKYLEDVYNHLAKRINIRVSRKDQIISVSVEDKDPKRAADMANTCLEALDRINRTVNITEGQRKRVFLEKRLKEAKNDLSRAEVELKEFQEKYKLVSIEEQAKVAIEGAAKIKGEIIVAQTELEVLKQFGTGRQNEAVMLKSKIAALQNQLAKIESGNPGTNVLKENGKVEGESNFYIPFNELPALGMQLGRLIREAKIQEKVFELVTSQYEMAQIEEAKDVNTIQILDHAVPPDKKSSPKRTLIVILSTVVAFFLSIFLAFFVEYFQRLKIEDKERYQQLVNSTKLRKSKI
jgi:uncharacterized protein involved in exopolysaccharide biosynthesis